MSPHPGNIGRLNGMIMARIVRLSGTSAKAEGDPLARVKDETQSQALCRAVSSLCAVEEVKDNR